MGMDEVMAAIDAHGERKLLSANVNVFAAMCRHQRLAAAQQRCSATEDAEIDRAIARLKAAVADLAREIQKAKAVLEERV